MLQVSSNHMLASNTHPHYYYQVPLHYITGPFGPIGRYSRPPHRLTTPSSGDPLVQNRGEEKLQLGKKGPLWACTLYAYTGLVRVCTGFVRGWGLLSAEEGVRA